MFSFTPQKYNKYFTCKHLFIKKTPNHPLGANHQLGVDVGVSPPSDVSVYFSQQNYNYYFNSKYIQKKLKDEFKDFRRQLLPLLQ